MSDRSEVRRTKDLFRSLLESEIDGCCLFDLRDEFLTSDGKFWCTCDEFLDISTDFWYNIDKDECHYRDKEEVEKRHDDIGRGVFCRESMPSITLSLFSPTMYFLRDSLSCFEKDIGTDEYDKKQCEKIE